MPWPPVALELVGNVPPGAGFALLLAAFVLIFGSRNSLNLAPVAIFGSSALVAWWLLSSWQWPPLPAALFSMLIGALLGVVVDHLAYGPRDRLSDYRPPLIAAIAFAGILEGLAPGRIGTALPTLTLPWSPVSRLPESWQDGLELAVLALLFCGARWLYGRTHLGRAARAIAADRQAAALLGIAVERTIALTCVGTAAMGAATGILAMLSVHAVR